MSDIEKTKSFQERMKDRIKKDIGELMTDDELSAIVERAVNEIFFKPRIVKDGCHHQNGKDYFISKDKTARGVIKQVIDKKNHSKRRR